MLLSDKKKFTHNCHRCGVSFTVSARAPYQLCEVCHEWLEMWALGQRAWKLTIKKIAAVQANQVRPIGVVQQARQIAA
jgi:hypothetical protein